MKIFFDKIKLTKCVAIRDTLTETTKKDCSDWKEMTPDENSNL